MSYIVLEGGDGCGKSTQALALVDRLCSDGRAVTHVREPGSTPLAESLRELLLTDTGRDIEPVTEALLFSAARRELLTRVIEPALARGEVVVAERSFVSTMVYQCLAPVEAADRVALSVVVAMTESVYEGSPWPAAVVVLDVPPDVRRARIDPRGELDRIESRGDEFAARVRDAFLELAESEELRRLVGADGFHVVDASGDADSVHSAVFDAIAGTLTREVAE